MRLGGPDRVRDRCGSRRHAPASDGSGMSVELLVSGPLFRGQPGRVIQRGVKNAIQELVEKGEERLAEMLRPRPSGVFLSVSEARRGHASTGNYRRNISSRVSGMHAVISDGGVVYGPWLEGVGSRNAVTRFKGYGSFRRVGQWLNTQKLRVFGRHMARAARDLN